MRSNYHQEFESIVNVSNYKEFLDRLGCNYSPEQMTVLLRNAVRAACAKHYGGLKLVDIIGDSHVEELPKNSTMTWDEVSILSKDFNFEEFKTTNRKVWIDRQNELRRQEKIRQNSNHSLGNSPPTNQNHFVEKKNNFKNDTTNFNPMKNQNHEREESNRKTSWNTTKTWGHKSRKFDSLPSGNTRTRSCDEDTNWRKR